LKKSFLSKYLFLRRNIRNWKEYTFKKGERSFRTLNFTTRPHSLHFEVNKNNYIVFKEIFVEDFYGLSSFISQLPGNATVVDIGANVGFFPVLMLSKKPTTTFFCYEPLPANIAHLKKLKKNNPSFDRQLNIYQFAVTDKSEGNITLFTEENADESSIASIHSDFDIRNKNSLSVPVTNLKSIVSGNNLDKIDILKLDCEGAEFPILYGTPDHVFEKIKFILLEVHNLDNERQNVEALNAFLREKDFDIESTPFHNNCYYVFASKKR
jgi:FkbM family methyltransferase